MNGLTSLFLKATDEDQAIIMWILLLDKDKQKEIMKRIENLNDEEKVKRLKELYFKNR